MKLLKIFSISSFVFVFSLFISTSVFSATPLEPSATSSNVVVLATVNIQSYKIVSQKDNVFDISFTLTNRTEVQSGVKYGVQLVGTDLKNRFVADEKIYPESLTLAEGSSVSKAIVYEAPKILSGTYDLLLMVKNQSGFPFGQALLGKVTLKSSIVGLVISQPSCFLQVVGEKNSPHYSLSEKVDITKDEILRLTCSALNSTDKALSVSPLFEAFYGSTFGADVSQTIGSKETIAFKPKEQKTFSINLPTADTPQTYTVNVKLAGSDIVSNTINASYILSGPNATIMNLFLDRDYYKKGETATLSLFYNSLKNVSIDSRIKNTENAQLNLSVKATILDDKSKACISPINQPLIQKPQSPITEIPVLINKDCLNPNVSITILDDKGNILDQKDFSVKSSSIPAGEKSISLVLFFIIGILVVAGIALYYFRNLKKKQNETIISQ